MSWSRRWRRFLSPSAGSLGTSVGVPPDVGQNLRQKYGDDFVTTIDPQDEMYQFLAGHPGIPEPIAAYFNSGESLYASLLRALPPNDTSRSDDRTWLDFACGHGRLTRFLVSSLGTERVTVSDIDHHAVDFCRRSFGVRGFYSTRHPRELTHPVRYHVILVVSLFSHLAFDLWGAWLERLAGLLDQDGILIFSTHGMHAYGLVDPAVRTSVTQIRQGFFYVPRSETRRLSTADYGTTYVSPEFVEDVLRSRRLGTLLAFHPRMLWEFQDGYVLRNP